MSPEQLDNYLLGCIVVCALGLVFNLFKIRTRGQSATLMAASCLVLGITLQLYRSGSPMPLVFAGGAAVLAILVYDAYGRMGKMGSKK